MTIEAKLFEYPNGSWALVVTDPDKLAGRPNCIGVFVDEAKAKKVAEQYGATVIE